MVLEVERDLAVGQNLVQTVLGQDEEAPVGLHPGLLGGGVNVDHDLVADPRTLRRGRQGLPGHLCGRRLSVDSAAVPAADAPLSLFEQLILVGFKMQGDSDQLRPRPRKWPIRTGHGGVAGADRGIVPARLVVNRP